MPNEIICAVSFEFERFGGLDGIIDYAVEDSEDWIALTDTLQSGDEFTASLLAMFDATKSTHIIRFRTRDLVGNTTLLHPIEYVDVSFHALSGIEEKTYMECHQNRLRSVPVYRTDAVNHYPWGLQC